MRMRIVLTAIVVLCSGCGGGGSSSPVDSAGGSGEWCDLPYYQNIIGNYVGNIEHQLIDRNGGAEVRNCQWDTSLVITGELIVNKCFLQIQLNAVPTQLYVPDASDPNVHQCRGDDSRIYRLDDPNQNVNNEDALLQVGFPVLVNPTGHELEPTRAPYFGDESVLAFQIYLFAGGAPIADQLLMSNEGYLELIENSPDTFFISNFQYRLNKEIAQ